MKVGKMAAIALGGGIILLQFAHQQGYITIDWNKINNKIDKATDKVEEAVTGQGPSFLDKVSLFGLIQNNYCLKLKFEICYQVHTYKYVHSKIYFIA